ncbi:MAG: 3'-5' exonuclease [bacterium]|nr:3'-5' exonuclease [bacterium]
MELTEATLAREVCFTALDFETTGTTRGYKSLPWQLGAIQFRIGEPLSDAPLFDTLIGVPPEHPFSKHAPGTHLEQRSAILAAPPFHTLWPALHQALSQTLPTAHNCATERNLLLHFAPMTRYPHWVDTLPLTRRIYPGLSSYALEDLIPQLGLQAQLSAYFPHRAPHDATYDAYACALLLQHLLSLPGWKDIPLTDILA